jgi:hypothetical protein
VGQDLRDDAPRVHVSGGHLGLGVVAPQYASGWVLAHAASCRHEHQAERGDVDACHSHIHLDTGSEKLVGAECVGTGVLTLEELLAV